MNDKDKELLWFILGIIGIVVGMLLVAFLLFVLFWAICLR